MQNCLDPNAKDCDRQFFEWGLGCNEWMDGKQKIEDVDVNMTVFELLDH